MKRGVFIVLGLGLSVLVFTGASSCSNLSGSGGKGSGATQVEFIVTGSAPAGADITYGDDTSNYQGHLPMDVIKTIRKKALWEQVTAQLQGGGNIRCKVIIGDAVKSGHAVGGYNICSAQLNSDAFNGGWG